MRVSRFHEEQIVRLLREQELSGQTVASFLRRHGINRHTFYRWRKKYGGLTETEAIRLKRLERENARLKGLLADRELELEVLKEIHAKKGHREAVVLRGVTREVSFPPVGRG